MYIRIYPEIHKSMQYSRGNVNHLMSVCTCNFNKLCLYVFASYSLSSSILPVPGTQLTFPATSAHP